MRNKGLAARVLRAAATGKSHKLPTCHWKYRKYNALMGQPGQRCHPGACHPWSRRRVSIHFAVYSELTKLLARPDFGSMRQIRSMGQG